MNVLVLGSRVIGVELAKDLAGNVYQSRVYAMSRATSAGSKK